MDRAEKVGLGVAAAGHLALFAILSATFLVPKQPMPVNKPMDVSLVEDVALQAAAPAATETPAASKAPEVGPIEDSPPPAPAEVAPEPAPPVPQPKAKPAPPVPQPKAAPKPPPKPAPVAKPQPKKAAAAPAKPSTPAKAPPKPAAAPKTTAKSAARPGTGSTATAKPAARPRGGSLGDIMKGIVPEAEPKARGETPRAAKLDAAALAGINDAIRRQIQPCADRQVNPGPGANQISTTLNLRFNANGTLSATPTVVRQSGLDDENGRYKQRVVDLGIAALRACSPLRLPPEFYRTAAGGWSNINFIWKLR